MLTGIAGTVSYGAGGGEYTITATSDDLTSESDTMTLTIIKVDIVSLSPDADLELGDDLAIECELDGPSGFTFDSVELHVLNYSDTQIYKLTGLGATMGPHSTTWNDAKWNQSPHSGAYANPNNGDYRVQIVATKGSAQCEDEESINTKFVIEADMKDEKSAGATAEASGMDDLGSALEVVAEKGTTTHVFAGASLTLSDIADGKHAKVDNSTLNSLADGTWVVRLKDVRDEIGNFYDANTGTTTIEHDEWTVELE